MIKKTFVLIFFVIFLVGIISAVDPEIRLFVSKGDIINLTEKCYNNGTYCSSSTVCNLTVINPEQILVLNNSNMTNQLSFHNFPSFSYTNTNGIYEMSVVCCDQGSCDKDTSFFQVNPAGISESTSNATFYIGIIIILVFLIILCTYGFTKTTTLWAQLSLFWATWILFIPLSYILWIGSANYLYTISFAGVFFKWVFYIQTVITFPLFLATIIWYFWMLIKASQLQRMIDRGVPENRVYADSIKRDGVKFI